MFVRRRRRGYVVVSQEHRDVVRRDARRFLVETADDRHALLAELEHASGVSLRGHSLGGIDPDPGLLGQVVEHLCLLLGGDVLRVADGLCRDHLVDVVEARLQVVEPDRPELANVLVHSGGLELYLDALDLGGQALGLLVQRRQLGLGLFPLLLLADLALDLVELQGRDAPCHMIVHGPDPVHVRAAQHGLCKVAAEALQERLQVGHGAPHLTPLTLTRY
ncbi:hypothetical protein [Cyprinid herpesvirus 3]|uniref:Uncharacterized protein n=1 Tax=Cyprinid herpesvirus 3 TaxID=180230 RepID=A4FTI8_CYHV3|nr:hypothetical protein [Cyprinid herpesvirus 3]